MWNKGFVHVYTGNGKGKTTAALGLAIRAAGAGIKVFIGHFLKGVNSSEHAILHKLFPIITVERFGRKGFAKREVKPEDKSSAQKGLERIKEVLKCGKYKLIILDEINVAVYYGLIDAEDVISLIKNKPEDVELVLTGRYAHPDVLKMADLVTEMKEIKHYSHKGIKARKGIEK